MVESLAQSGRTRTLIHPGPISGVHDSMTKPQLQDAFLTQVITAESGMDVRTGRSAYPFSGSCNKGNSYPLIQPDTNNNFKDRDRECPKKATQ
jgi:hypothetical protein